MVMHLGHQMVMHLDLMKEHQMVMQMVLMKGLSLGLSLL